MSAGVVIALLGAESTGKTTLARGLAEVFAGPDRRVAVVDEYLRAFCDQHGRTPRRDEQPAIAAEQNRRIAAAADAHDLVFADTTALLTAVYSDWVLGDAGLYPGAERAHALQCHLTLLTALDLAWQPDGLQRDGPGVREPVDGLIRAALARAGVGYAVIVGQGPSRLGAAVASVERALAPAADAHLPARWQWHCERCGDPACERRMPLG